MPTYSYACTSCGHAFDIRQSFSDDALTVCPECTEKALRKVIHPVGISFKGSGFYKTDSRASSGKGSSATGSAASASGSSGSSESSGSSGSSGSSESSSSTPAASGSSTASSTPAAAASSTAS